MDKNKIMEYVHNLFNSAERRNYVNQLGDICDFVLPSESGFFNGRTIGGDKTSRIHHSFPVIANETLANTLRSMILPSSSEWGGIRFSVDELNVDREASIWLERARNKLFHALAASNFYQESGRAFKMWTGLGTGCVDIAEKNPDSSKFSGFLFKANHIAFVSWLENSEGWVDVSARKFRMTLHELISKYGPHEDWSGEDLSQHREVVTLLTPNEDGTFIERVIDVEGGRTLESRKFTGQPRFIFRWETMPESSMGYSPAHTAYHTIKALNTTRYETLQSRALQNRPPLLTESDLLFDTLDLSPASLNVVDDISGIRPLDLGTNPNTQSLTEEELKKEISQAFLLDKIQLPPRDEIGEMTMFETAKRWEEISRAVGPVTERLLKEYLQPVLLRAFTMMFNKGEFGPLPSKIKKKGDMDIDFVFENQVTRAAAAADLQAVQQAFQFSMMIAQVDPEAPKRLLNLEEAQRLVNHALATPPSLMKDPKQQQEYMAQEQQMIEANRQHELALRGQLPDADANAE